MSEPFMPINQQDVVDYYKNNVTVKVPEVAAHFGLKPGQVSAILSLHGVPVRRGAGNLTAEARAAGLATRKEKALLRRLLALVEEYGADKVEATLPEAVTAAATNAEFEGNG